ncbi:MAG: alpha/beta fold hydrolase [Gemmatimonadaceae bacterium]
MSLFRLVALTLAGISTALLVVWVRRGRLAATQRRHDWQRRHPLGPDGVIPGAGPIALDGDARAVVVVHGFGDTPQSVAVLAAALHARGFTVRVPLLPGHGRSLDAFLRSRAAEWKAEVRRAIDELNERHESLCIIGLSMGGALAALLSQELETASNNTQEVAGDRAGRRCQLVALVLLAPYLEVPAMGRLLTSIWPLWTLRRPWVEGDDSASILDPEQRARSLGFGGATPRLLYQLRRIAAEALAATPQLQLPTLAIFSTSDYRIPAEAARRIFQCLTASMKELVWVERSGHVITVDRDADFVIARSVEWAERFCPLPAAAEASNDTP